MNQALFDSLYRDTQSGLRSLASQVIGGLDPGVFGRRMARLLEYQNAEAVLIGKQAAGDFGELDDDDQTFAAHIVNEQLDYIAGFCGGHPDGDAERGAGRSAGAILRGYGASHRESGACPGGG